MKKLFALLLIGMWCSLLSAQEPQNLIVNPGFESGTANWYGDRCSISSTTATKHSGLRSLYVNFRQGYTAGPAQNITSPINNGSSYDAETWIKTKSGSAYVRIALIVKTATQTYYFKTSAFSVNSSQWKKVAGALAPQWTGTLASASFRIETSSGTSSFYADDVLLTENHSYAAKYPFPYTQPGLLGIKPSATIDTKADILAYYDKWKSAFVKTQTVVIGGGATKIVSYVQGGTTGDTSGEWGNDYYAITASEHTGYGMLISVIMGDWTTFFQMSNLHDIFKSSASPNLMSWAVPARKTDGKIVTNLNRVSDAPDGDMDIALAYLMAYYQWNPGNDWCLNRAKRMIKDLNNKLVYCQHPKIYWIKLADDIKDLDDNGNPNRIALVTRPSDFMISHLKFFYNASPQDAIQLNYAATDMMTILDAFRTDWSPVGLVSDFMDLNDDSWFHVKYGKIGHFAPASNSDSWIKVLGEDKPSAYSWNACRVPLRLALSYRFGESYLKEWLSATVAPRGMVDWLWKDVAKVTANPDTWFNNIKGSIKLDGTFLENDVNNSFIAPFVAGCVIDIKYQAELDKGWNYIKTKQVNYYDDTLTLLSMLVASGYWWMPK